MPSGKARFSGAKTVTLTDVDSQVKEIVKRSIPALFDDEGEEHEDFAGTLEEIQGAVWIAARIIADLSQMNSAADTKRELQVLTRDGWIVELQARLATNNINRLSDESWWAIVDRGGNPITPTGAIAGARRAVNMASPERPKAQAVYYAAAMEMTVRVIASLTGHENSLRIKIVTYREPLPPTPIVKLLKELGETAGIFRADGVWRNHLATAKRKSNRSAE